MKTVVFDAGHGGPDSGAVSPTGIKESDLNLKVQKLAIEKLKEYEVRTIPTRVSKDMFLTLQERAWIANKNNADLFVSIHFNASREHKAQGYEVFHFPDSAPGKKAASFWIDNFQLEFPHMWRRGVKEAPFAVLEGTDAPAILVENCFIDNLEGEALVQQEEALDKMATALARTVIQFLDLKLRDLPDPAVPDMPSRPLAGFSNEALLNELRTRLEE